MAALLKFLTTPAPQETKIARDSAIEFMATVLFVFSGTLSAISTGRKEIVSSVRNDVARILPIAVSFGISITALAHSIGHLTGGHMNPGVSLLMFLKRKISLVKMLCYWTSQFSGAVVASLLVWGCTSRLTESLPSECAASALQQGVDCGAIGNPPFGLGATTLDPALSLGNGFLLELMGSIVFYYVITQTALDERGIANTGFPALPIGLVLIVVHICLIPFTGCGVNPARTFGPFLVNCLAGECAAEMEWFWIYYVGPATAAVIVAEITTWMEDGAVAEGEKNNKEMTAKDSAAAGTFDDRL